MVSGRFSRDEHFPSSSSWTSASQLPPSLQNGDYNITKIVPPPPSWSLESWSERAYHEPWLDIYNRRTPYDEDEIVALIHEYIRLVEQVAPIDDEDCRAKFPPPGGHTINEELCRQHGANENVISLMKRLPYGSFHDGVHWATWSYAIDYADDSVIEARTENPSCPADENADVYLDVEPHVICLTDGDRESLNIFLDTEENTIRVTSIGTWPIIPSSSGYVPPPQFINTCHYRAYEPKHAPTWLRQRIQRLKSLDLIPGASEMTHEHYFSFQECPWVWMKIRAALVGTYGWHDGFDEERWKREKVQVWEDAFRQDESIGSPQLEFMIARR